MARKRRRFSAEFKARVVRAALREDKTLGQPGMPGPQRAIESLTAGTT